MMFRSILNVHIALGSIGLLLGPLVLFGRKTSPAHPILGEIYHAVMLGICGKDCRVVTKPILGGLHHEYWLENIAA